MSVESGGKCGGIIHDKLVKTLGSSSSMQFSMWERQNMHVLSYLWLRALYDWNNSKHPQILLFIKVSPTIALSSRSPFIPYVQNSSSSSQVSVTPAALPPSSYTYYKPYDDDPCAHKYNGHQRTVTNQHTTRTNQRYSITQSQDKKNYANKVWIVLV